MQIVETRGSDAVALAYVARLDDGSLIEMAEAVQPPIPRQQKWVLIVSSLKGCPFGCPICDAGSAYGGTLSAAEILGQVEWLVRRRFGNGPVPTPKLKVQFARMGDPSLNDAVLEVLRALPARLEAPGLMPCISTVAPIGRDRFFDELVEIKRSLYPGGHFQMQFSLHTTDEAARRVLVPARTWSFAQMARFGERFVEPGDRKITLNFAPVRGAPLDAAMLADRFSPDLFLVKLTPINPTIAATRAGIVGALDPDDPKGCDRIAEPFRDHGFETLVSIGELDENQIGSNCGMLVRTTAPTGDRSPASVLALAV